LRTARIRPHAWVQPDGEYVDEDLMWTADRGQIELLVAGRLVEARDHRGIDVCHAALSQY
jgi:hypothetical protein